MAKQGQGQLIEETRELTAMSRDFCETSRRTKEKSKNEVERASKAVAFARSRHVRKRRRRLLAKTA
jgi:hypothetical protein